MELNDIIRSINFGATKEDFKIAKYVQTMTNFYISFENMHHFGSEVFLIPNSFTLIALPPT